MTTVPAISRQTIGFYLFHAPGIGWVCSVGDVHFRVLIRYHVVARVGSYETWLKRLAPGLRYHFVWNEDYQSLAFIGTTVTRNGTDTLASPSQIIWR